MRLVEAQLFQWLGWVLRDHAMIVSGAYKFKRTQVGCGKNEDGTVKFRSCTDEEKLRDTMGTMENHLKLVCDCVDYMGEHQHDPHDANPEPRSLEQAKPLFRQLWDDLWEEPKNPPEEPPR